jgi:hypothetical protein
MARGGQIDFPEVGSHRASTPWRGLLGRITDLEDRDGLEVELLRAPLAGHQVLTV